MVVEDKVLPGEELFKFLNYLIEQNSNNSDNVNNDLMPPRNEHSNNTNGHKNMGPMHNSNPMNLNNPGNMKNLNIPGSQSDDVKNVMESMRKGIETENSMMPQNQSVEPQNDDD